MDSEKWSDPGFGAHATRRRWHHLSRCERQGQEASVRAQSGIPRGAVRPELPIKCSHTNSQVDSLIQESGAHGERSGGRQECEVIGTEVTVKLSGLDGAGGRVLGCFNIQSTARG